MELTFTRPSILWFLFCVPLLFMTHMVAMQLKKKVAIKFSHFDLVAKSIKKGAVSSAYTSYMSKRDWVLLLTRSVALAALILAASGATVWYMGTASDQDYVLLIDNSNSMTATDIYPSRIDATKEAAQRFVDSIDKPANVGVISFSGVGVVETRPVRDTRLVKQKIDAITASEVGGTDIGGALIAGTNLLLGYERDRTIVLLTDGRSNLGIHIDDAISYAKRENVNVFTIGIGTDTGGYLEDFPLVAFTLDDSTLNTIANQTGGRYYQASTKEEILGAYVDIAQSSERLISRNLASGLLILALAFLFFEWGFLSFRYRVIP